MRTWLCTTASILMAGVKVLIIIPRAW